MNPKHYLKIGDRGLIERAGITSISQSLSTVVVVVNGHSFHNFTFPTIAEAQKALAAAIAELTGEATQNPAYRFFRDDARVFVVPANGDDLGRSYYFAGRGWGNCNWSLDEMINDCDSKEITQSEFEAAAGTDWLDKLVRL